MQFDKRQTTRRELMLVFLELLLLIACAYFKYSNMA
jgi:hypothetical protein